MVYHHKISDIERLKHMLNNCWTQLGQAWHIEPSDQLVAKKTDVGYQGEGGQW